MNPLLEWLRAPAAAQSAALAEVAWVLIAGALALLAGTTLLLVLALRGRLRGRPAWWIGGGGLALPLVLLSALMLYGTARTAGLERLPGSPGLVVQVTGHSWWWEVRYRLPDGREAVLANELHLPLGQPAWIAIESADVIHSVWVPALGGKMDAVPGRSNRLAVTPTRAGVFRGLCAEYCGTQHARMAFIVVVEPAAQFERWLQQQAADKPPPADAMGARGRDAFLANGCGACHAVRGVSDGALGPNLTHLGSRLELGAGVLPNDRAAIVQWIRRVQALKPGARMPSFEHLDAETVQAMAAWLGPRP